MKRILSAVLSLVMMISMIQTVSAGPTIDSSTTWVPNPLELPLQLTVLARETGSGNSYESAPEVNFVSGGSAKVDYRAELNMLPIRNFFEAAYFESGGGYDRTKEEFDKAKITTEIKVIIEYPAEYLEPDVDLMTAGGLVNNNGIFAEKEARQIAGNKVTITYENTDLTAGELYANYKASANPAINSYLADLAFELNDAISYTEVGQYTVSVTMSGSTTIDFESKEQVVKYVGGSQNIVTIQEEVPIPPVAHMVEVVPAVPATCKEDGYTRSVKCSIHNSYTCGALGVYPPESIPKLNHMLAGVSSKILILEHPATCAKDGIKAHETCILCKQDFLNGEEVDHDKLIISRSTIPHTPKTITGTAPDCIHTGLSSSIFCEVCKKILTPATVLDALGHQEETIKGKKATCTTDGLSDGKKCKRCEETTVSQKKIPALGHDFGDWEVIRPATEQAEGLKERVCNNDPSHKETITIPKLAHEHKIDPNAEVITKHPGCTKPGKKQNHCACGHPMGPEVEVPPTGHKTSKVSATPSTCTKEGTVEHYACVNKDCKETFYDEAATQKRNDIKAPKDPHNHNNQHVTIPGSKPTCTRKGLTDGTKCGACNKVLVPQDVIDFADHEFEDIGRKNPTCTKPGVKEHLHCKVCNDDFDEHRNKRDASYFHIPAMDHDYGEAVPKHGHEPTETEHGVGTRTCKNDSSHTIDIDIGKKNHEHDENSTYHEVVTKEATCTETGLKDIIWDCCSKIKESNIVIPKRTDTIIFVEKVEPTCFSEGVKSHYMCKNCDKLFSNADMTEQITKEDLIEEKLTHHFRVVKDTPKERIERCDHCHETIRTVKENVENNVDVHDMKGFKNERDRVAEQLEKEENPNVKIEKEVTVTVEERKDASPELHEELPKNVDEKKVIYEITVERITRHDDVIVQRENISKTDDLITLDVSIPSEMHNKEGYAVYRRHHTEEKGHHVHVMTSTKNDHGEWIEYLDQSGTVTDNPALAHKLRLHAMNFSEYVIVSFSSAADAPIDPTPIDPITGTTSGGSVSSTYTIKFTANGGSPVDNIKVKKGEKLTAPVTTREGYTFAGWYTDVALTVPFDFETEIKSSMTLYAKWRQDGVPVVTTEIGGVSKDISVTEEDGKHSINVDEIEVPEKDGFAFDGWYTNPQLTDEVSGILEITEDTTLYPGYICLITPQNLISDEHIAYIHGYPDGEVKPNGNITREEVVAALYRLLKPEHRTTIETAEHAFPDVNADRWSVEEIATMANGGYIVGDENGNFNPSNPITRAEFVTIAVKFMNEVEVPKANYFSDISGHWAEESIKKAAHSFYWILGYADGTFKPNNFITRAEAMTIINKMLVRYGDHTSEHAADWPDVSENDWFYSNVIEATTHNHAFDRHDNGWSETWTGIAE